MTSLAHLNIFASLSSPLGYHVITYNHIHSGIIIIYVFTVLLLHINKWIIYIYIYIYINVCIYGILVIIHCRWGREGPRRTFYKSCLVFLGTWIYPNKFSVLRGLYYKWILPNKFYVLRGIYPNKFYVFGFYAENVLQVMFSVFGYIVILQVMLLVIYSVIYSVMLLVMLLVIFAENILQVMFSVFGCMNIHVFFSF